MGAVDCATGTAGWVLRTGVAPAVALAPDIGLRLAQPLAARLTATMTNRLKCAGASHRTVARMAVEWVDSNKRLLYCNSLS